MTSYSPTMAPESQEAAVNCIVCALPLTDASTPCPRCTQRRIEAEFVATLPTRPAPPRSLPAKFVAPFILISLGILTGVSLWGGAQSSGSTRATWTATPSSPQELTVLLLRQYAREVFGTATSRSGVAAWWISVLDWTVEPPYAIARTSLSDTARETKVAVEICAALVHFVADSRREGLRLTCVRVVGQDDMVLIDTIVRNTDFDPCQELSARPVRTR
ncbi:MAG: hypothetical protein NTX54_07170 [Chloroflexi bacterium]|nr:hypothetical protein [Chloroflexota bacterium]